MTLGPKDAAASVFIYKQDGTEKSAWTTAEEIFNSEGPIRVEVHGQKAEFLAAITTWNNRVVGTKAFLAIYAHMSTLGMNCRGQMDANAVRWPELAAALTNGIAYLWLVGCKSKFALPEWAALSHPVKLRVLATSTSRYWEPLLRFFGYEISISTIAFDDEMLDRIRARAPALAAATRYFEPPF